MVYFIHSQLKQRESEIARLEMRGGKSRRHERLTRNESHLATKFETGRMCKETYFSSLMYGMLMLIEIYGLKWMQAKRDGKKIASKSEHLSLSNENKKGFAKNQNKLHIFSLFVPFSSNRGKYEEITHWSKSSLSSSLCHLLAPRLHIVTIYLRLLEVQCARATSANPHCKDQSFLSITLCCSYEPTDRRAQAWNSFGCSQRSEERTKQKRIFIKFKSNLTWICARKTNFRTCTA